MQVVPRNQQRETKYQSRVLEPTSDFLRQADICSLIRRFGNVPKGSSHARSAARPILADKQTFAR